MVFLLNSNLKPSAQNFPALGTGKTFRDHIPDLNSICLHIKKWLCFSEAKFFYFMFYLELQFKNSDRISDFETDVYIVEIGRAHV